jgi:hypothetical protein
MTKAAQLAAQLEQLDVDQGMETIQAQAQASLHFDVIDDVMCIMHSDGSANMIAHVGAGAVTVETISPGNILRVLRHYRPFKDVFTNHVQ